MGREKVEGYKMRIGKPIFRNCYACGSAETYIAKDGWRAWYKNRDEDDNALCESCFQKYISRPKYGKIYGKMIRQRTIMLKGKRKRLATNARKGICSKCGAVRGKDCIRTSIHHEIYDESDPLAYTKELCNSCHAARTWELGQIPLSRRGV